jgi:hypothetical protein
MSLTRDDVRDAVERGGEDQMQILRKFHEDAYPKSRPTPGDICRAEADRLNQMGLGDAQGLELAESHVERVDDKVRLTHVFRYKPSGARLVTEPYEGYG